MYGEDVDYWRNRCLTSEKNTAALQAELAKLQDLLALERQHRSEFVVIGKKVVPITIVHWMNQYDMPWDMFWCKDHHKWFDELDEYFPHFMSGCRCDRCK
mgnify:CR=1